MEELTEKETKEKLELSIDLIDNLNDNIVALVTDGLPVGLYPRKDIPKAVQKSVQGLIDAREIFVQAIKDWQCENA